MHFMYYIITTIIYRVDIIPIYLMRMYSVWIVKVFVIVVCVVIVLGLGLITGILSCFGYDNGGI